MGFPGGSDGKESACNARDPGSIPGSGRSPGEGNVYPLQYTRLENSTDRGSWRPTGHGVAESDMTEQLTLSLSFPLFILYAEYIMQNGRLDESQAGIKIAERNINNLRYTNDTTLVAESEEELKNLLMRVKEESEKAGLKLNIQKRKIMVSSPITSWQIDGEKVKAGTDFISGVLSTKIYQNHCGQ